MSYDTFKEAISQLFQDEDFTEDVYINGFKTKCFCSSISDSIAFTGAGMIDEVNFVLDVQIASLDFMPQQNDKVLFRNKEYKISHTETDSANASIKLYLISLSKGK